MDGLVRAIGEVGPAIIQRLQSRSQTNTETPFESSSQAHIRRSNPAEKGHGPVVHHV